MRAKIPQLREALASRFQIEHHGIIVAQLLAHIDALDGAIQNLSERIEFVLTPHAQIIELLSTIPGVVAYFRHRPRKVPYRDLGPDWQRKRHSIRPTRNRTSRLTG